MRTVESRNTTIEQPRQMRLSGRTWFVLASITLAYLLFATAWSWLSKNGGQLWAHLAPFVIGVGVLIFVAGATMLAWKIYKAWSTHKSVILHNQILKEEAESKKTSRGILQETLAIVQDARVNGDDIEFHYGDDGSIRGLKVTRPKAAQINNNLVIQELRGYIDELAQQRIAEPVLPLIDVPHTPHDAIHLSPAYNVPADDVLSGRKLIVGVSGSGKSNTVGTYGEELGRLEVPFVLADTEDEYQPLCNKLWLPRGIVAGATGEFSIAPDNAADFGRFILDQQMQVILNLQSYDMPTAALVMIGIITGMREWQEERANEVRIPCDFILEEAVTWLPQNIKESPLHGTEELARLQGTIFNDMVRKGRKRGLGITLICQRIAELDKRALQSDTKLLHRQTENTDIDVYKEMGVSREETLNLGNGEAFLFTSRVSKMKLQVRKRYSPHGANTPGLANLRRHQVLSNLVEETPKFVPEMISDSKDDFGFSRNDFDTPTERVTGNISEFRTNPLSSSKNGVKGVPEEIQTAIEDLYKSGEYRTDLQEMLKLNDDQYKWIKAVCDNYDRAYGVPPKKKNRNRS